MKKHWKLCAILVVVLLLVLWLGRTKSFRFTVDQSKLTHMEITFLQPYATPEPLRDGTLLLTLDEAGESIVDENGHRKASQKGQALLSLFTETSYEKAKHPAVGFTDGTKDLTILTFLVLEDEGETQISLSNEHPYLWITSKATGASDTYLPVGQTTEMLYEQIVALLEEEGKPIS